MSGDSDTSEPAVCGACGATVGLATYGYHPAYFARNALGRDGLVRTTKYGAVPTPRTMSLCLGCVGRKRTERRKVAAGLASFSLAAAVMTLQGIGGALATAGLVIVLSLGALFLYALYLARLPQDEMGDALAADLSRERVFAEGYDALLGRAQFERMVAAYAESEGHKKKGPG